MLLFLAFYKIWRQILIWQHNQFNLESNKVENYHTFAVYYIVFAAQLSDSDSSSGSGSGSDDGITDDNNNKHWC